jgi:hypothetical protein
MQPVFANFAQPHRDMDERASTSSPRVAASSLRRLACAQPADPAPTITSSMLCRAAVGSRRLGRRIILNYEFLDAERHKGCMAAIKTAHGETDPVVIAAGP